MRRSWLLAALLACGAPEDDDAATVDDTEIAEPTPDRDMVRACIAEQWVRSTCTGCHFAGTWLDLERDALATLASAARQDDPDAPLLVAGQPDVSLLVRKLEAKVGLVELEEGEGDPMPPDTPIEPEDAALIRDWVASGAVLPEGC